MLEVETYIDRSKIHGFGLFAKQDIEKGTITWRFNPAIDISINPGQLVELPEITRKFIEEYGSLSKITGNYILSADNTRFTNHNSSPNLDTRVVEGEPEAIAVANRYIKQGEEMTIDYHGFDKISDESNSNYLK